MTTFTNEEKIQIANQIKDISMDIVEKEYKELINIGMNACNMSERCLIGNNIVDYFTFVQRLETKGKYNINYFDFLNNIEEFKKKHFIQNMLHYYETVKNKKGKKNKYTVLKEVYNICITAINIIRPLVYMEIYHTYKPHTILDFCAGWGGAAVAASCLNVHKYIGIEINKSLDIPYQNLRQFLNKKSNTELEIHFTDALTVDYGSFDYDFVFTSPPYYFIQKYENNAIYKNKAEMDELFYKPLFSKTFNGLKTGGHYILNINKEIYNRVCISLFGEAHDVYHYKKSKRQNNYKEMVYVWNKNK